MENTEHIWSHVKVEPELPSQSNCLMPSTFPTWKQSPIPFALSLKAHCVPENSLRGDKTANVMTLGLMTTKRNQKS